MYRHRVYHRWSRWWARRGTRSLSVHYFSSYLLCLLKVETHAWSQRTCIKHLFLVLLTTLLDWTGLNTKKPKWRVQTERRRQTGTHFFLKKNLKQIKNYHPPKKKSKKIKKMPCYQGTGLGCPVALLAGFPSKLKSEDSSTGMLRRLNSWSCKKAVSFPMSLQE